MEEDGPSGSRWWRQGLWPWVLIALAVAAAGGAALAAARDGAGDRGSAPCRAVVRATREVGEGKRSQSSLLEVVRAQEPLARAEADRDPALAGVAQAISAMREDLEAGQRVRSVVVLYEACG